MPRRPGRPPKKPERRRRFTGSVHHRKDGSWAAVTPRSLGRRATYHPSKAAAEAWLKEQLDGPPSPATDTSRLGPYLAAWYERHKPRMPENTRSAYLYGIGKLAALHARPVRDLKRSEITAALLALLDDGYSRATVRQARAVLHNALEEAVGDGIILANPVGRLVLPPEPRKPPPAYDAEQVAALLDAAAAHPLGALVALVATCGMRIGELCALQWRDVDWQAGTLAIHAAMGKAGNIPNESTKGRASRVIELPAVTLEALRRHRDAQPVLSCWIIPSPRNPRNPISRSKVRQVWRECCAAAGLAPIVVHGARHTTATVLAAAGVPITAISALLGHSRPSITMDHYSHAMASDRTRTARAMDRALSESKSPDKSASAQG